MNLPYLHTILILEKYSEYSTQSTKYFVLEYFFEYYKNILGVEYRVPKKAVLSSE